MALLRFSLQATAARGTGMNLVIYPQALPPILTTLTTFCLVHMHLLSQYSPLPPPIAYGSLWCKEGCNYTFAIS